MSEIPHDVRHAFGLTGEPVPLESGKVSRTWRATSDSGRVAVRASPPHRSLDEVRYEHALLHALGVTGAPVPAPVAGPVVSDATVWSAFGWVEGTHPEPPVPDPASYGRLLAELHAHTDAVLPAVGSRPGWRRLDEFSTNVHASGWTLAEVLPKFAATAGDIGRSLEALASEVDRRLRDAGCADLTTTLAHGDFGPYQVLRADDGTVTAVLDWDFAHPDLRVTDLAIGTALARPTVERAAEMLAAYLEVAELPHQELRLMADLRRARHFASLAAALCGVWVRGGDVTERVATAVARLEREAWWGPMLDEAVAAVTGIRTA